MITSALPLHKSARLSGKISSTISSINCMWPLGLSPFEGCDYRQHINLTEKFPLLSVAVESLVFSRVAALRPPKLFCVSSLRY